MDYTALLLLIIVVVLFYVTRNRDEPTQEEIQKLEHAKEAKTEINGIPDFPHPQISRGFKRLSRDIKKPLNTLKDILPNNKPKVNVIRDTNDNINKKRAYLPDYFRKDRLGQNDIGNEEVRPFITDNKKSEKSWTEENVSDHPKFYTSDVQNELTNVGLFFDKNNQYNDKSSVNTEVLISDKCYKDKNGVEFCEDNTRLQNIPPSLITDIKRCHALNNVGIYKDNKNKGNSEFSIETIHGSSVGSWTYDDDRLINGGKFYNEVKGSNHKNEEFSEPLKPLLGSCS